MSMCRVFLNLSPILIYGAIFSKSLIQFTLDGCGCIQALVFELRPNYGRGNESNWDLLQKDLSKHSCIQCPSPWCFPFLDHVSTGHSWTLTSNTGSVSCGNTALTLGSWWTQALFVPSNSLLQSCGSSIIKSSWPPMSNSLWVLSTFARSPGWKICSCSKISLPIQ